MSIIDRLYSISARDKDSRKYKYIDEHEKSLRKLESDLDKIKASWQIENAEGRELDELGKMFGRFGERRGRDDEDYRAYLKSIINSFSGRGTISDIKFALETSIMRDTTNIQINEIFGEYFQQKVEIRNKKSGSLEHPPIRYRDDDGNPSSNYVTWTDINSNTDLSVNLVNGSLPSPNTDEVVIDWSTGDWVADSNTSGDYDVQYEEQEMLAYELSLQEPWQSHSSEVLVEISDIADASGVELRTPINRDLIPYNIKIEFNSTQRRTNLYSYPINIVFDDTKRRTNQYSYDINLSFSNTDSTSNKSSESVFNISTENTENSEVSRGLGAGTIGDEQISNIT